MSYHLTAGWLFGLTLCLASPLASIAQSPTPAPTAATLDEPAAPAEEPVEWGNSALNIPVTSNDTVTFGPPGSTVVLVGKDVWDFKTGQRLNPLVGDYPRDAIRALSSDGKWFASGLKGPNQQGTVIGVWSLETGEQVAQIPARADEYTDFIAFTTGPGLVVSGRDSKAEYKVYDPKTGTPLRSFKAIDQPRNRALSPDGRHMALVGYDSLTVWNLATGTRAAVMKAPAVPRRNAAAETETTTNKPRPRTTLEAARARQSPGPRSSIDTILMYSDCDALQFAPNGKELAAVFGHRLVVWNNAGSVMYNEPLPATLGYNEGTIAWLPDNSGWLIGGRFLIDRKSKRHVMKLGGISTSRFLDRDHLLALRGSGGNAALEVIEIPWAEAQKSIDALNDPKAPAYLRPGQAVSVMVDMDKLRGDPNQTREKLLDALKKRLAQDGIRVADDQDVVMSLRFSEEAGDTLKIVERDWPSFGRFGREEREIGSATEAKATLVLELYTKDQNKPVWADVLTSVSGRTFSEAINDGTLRENAISNLMYSMANVQLPYFIPADDTLSELPMWVD